MTDAPVEQQGEAKRRKEQQRMPETADITSSSRSSSDSSIDTEVG